MPYTTDAEYALCEALGVYDVGSSFKANDEIKTKGVVDFIKVSYDNNYLATYDESEELTLWNAKTFKKIKTYNDIYGFTFDENDFSFIGEDYFSYINKDGNVIIVATKNGDKLKEIKKEDSSFQFVRGHFETKYLTYADNKNLTIYDLLNNKTIGTIKYDNDIVRQSFYSEDGKYLFASTIENQFNVDKEQYITVHVIDTSNTKEINSIKFNAGYISNMFTKDNNVYMLFNRTMGSNFNLLAASYNYIDNNLNWSRTEDGIWGKIITRSYKEGVNDIGIVHGRLETDEKNAIMDGFNNREIDILVSTTVIEVGINNSNATVMMIENAEKFGLAQLHQLRGRVGRGEAQSYCIMLCSSENKDALDRLDILNKSNDGFYIANEDLKLRGPGDFFGVRQSGDMLFKLGDIYNNADVLKMANEAIEYLKKEGYPLESLTDKNTAVYL